ncbi:MAG: transcription elongation factor GreB [Pseudomonadota bacterium]
MSRYRPPRPKSAPYITPDGYQRMQAELQDLWKNKRPAVTAKVAEAAAQGDRSENAEYIYGKKQLREIDSRIGFLSRRMDELQIVDQTPRDADKVFFGAWVELEDDQGNLSTFRIVGADEIEVQPNYISIDAPLARALLGKQMDDEVSIQQRNDSTHVLKLGQQAHHTTYCIVGVRYCEK